VRGLENDYEAGVGNKDRAAMARPQRLISLQRNQSPSGTTGRTALHERKPDMSTATLELQEVEQAQVGAVSTPDWTNLGGAFRGTPTSLFFGGSLFALTRNTNNTLGLCQVSGSSGKWSSFGGTLISSPGAAASPNGTIGVLGLMQNGQVQVSYVNPFQNTATSWQTISGGTPGGRTFVGSPVLAVNTNARIEAFAMDSTGMMWHTYQTTVSTPIQWFNWSPLGSAPNGFNTTASFTVFLLSNKGALQAVAIGKDNKMYQSTQFAGGGNDGWSVFNVIGQGPGGTEAFTTGTAARFCISTQNAAYAGLNSNVGVNNNPLVFCAPPSFSTWGAINLALEQFPVPTAAPVMVDNSGTPQLTWLSQNTFQVQFVSQSASAPNFWQSVQTVGGQNGNFTGDMAGIANGGNVALFQRCSDTTLAYINYAPPF